jgi:translation initiation factor 1
MSAAGGLTDLYFTSNQDIDVEEPQVASHVHIRIQQRSGRKSLTTVQGLADDLDLKKILKALKKV